MESSSIPEHEVGHWAIAAQTEDHQQAALTAMWLLNKGDPNIRSLVPESMTRAGWLISSTWNWRIYAWVHIMRETLK